MLVLMFESNSLGLSCLAGVSLSRGEEKPPKTVSPVSFNREVPSQQMREWRPPNW
jgi:hypothetical protein